MAKIITVNAYHEGAGVSTIAANLAVILAQGGRRVALIDASISAPTQYLLYNLSTPELPPTFNDFVLGRCDLAPAAHPLPAGTLSLGAGKLFLIPADPDWNEIRRAQQAPCGVEHLGPAVQRMMGLLRLDAVVIDSDAGLPESALAAIALSDTLLSVVQLDQQRYEGTGVALEVAGKFNVPQRTLVVNSASPSFDTSAVRSAIEQAYQWPVAGVVPYCEELAALCSAAVFAVRYPDHAVTGILRQVAETL
jgi:MinD-like ATPase involved in chromosome partitioning or flagellar assembly